MYPGAGGRVIAIADATGAVVKQIIDITALWHHTTETGGVKGFSGAESLDPAKIFTLECDVLLPAALGNVIPKPMSKTSNAKS
ncbi:MAG: hypothetical protein IPO31_27655 [Candidatus Obscuribacter sp.]|nr:hypothetical protein [Candidatus Obscuribacter sp.]